MKGSTLAKLRASRPGLTQTAVAERMGVSRQRVATLEARDEGLKPETVLRYLQAVYPGARITATISYEVDSVPVATEDLSL